MTYITLDNQYVTPFVESDEFIDMSERVQQAHKQLHEKTGSGNDCLGWLDLPETFDKTELQQIERAAKQIQKNSSVLLVIGIGGSYLGSRAAIELLTHTFQRELSNGQRTVPKVIFVGHHLSTKYIQELFVVLNGHDVPLNVISKSGTTTEPAIAFRIFKKWLEEKYGKKEARKRIYVTTDKQHGALKTLANLEGYQSFVVPDDVGGRYSVLTAVGLLPIAVSGIDINEILTGAKLAMNELDTDDVKENPCYHYVALRNLLYDHNKKIEFLISYEPQFHYFQEWWKQLFGESEGKDGKGIFPAAASYSTDLHSLGQYVQDGKRHLFQTVLAVREDPGPLYIEADEKNLDGLNYLVDHSLAEINEKAFYGALAAHVDGGVPNIVLNIPKMDAFTFGYLVYFFEKACAISGYVLGVNPFDQPGVENYKNNMFKLLGKPGY